MRAKLRRAKYVGVYTKYVRQQRRKEREQQQDVTAVIASNYSYKGAKRDGEAWQQRDSMSCTSEDEESEAIEAAEKGTY